MNVLLVNPEFPDTYWGFKHALKIIGKDSIFAPLGLQTVAALLPQSWRKRLLDLNAGDVLRPIDIEWADMVFVTGMLIQKKAILRVVKECRAYGKLVVVGGPYISTSTQNVPDADHVFIGEAEATLPQFVSDLEQGVAKRFYKATVFPEMTTTPMPDFGLVDMSRYTTMSVQFSRGCPFDCEFCDITKIYGRKPRPKGNAQLLGELDALLALGWRGPVFIVDDNFIGNLTKVRLLAPDLIKEDNLVYVFGRISLREEEPKLIAEEIMPLEKVKEKFTKSVLIKISTTGLVENTMVDVKNALSKHKGKTPVFIDLISPEECETRTALLAKGTGREVLPVSVKDQTSLKKLSDRLTNILNKK